MKNSSHRSPSLLTSRPPTTHRNSLLNRRLSLFVISRQGSPWAAGHHLLSLAARLPLPSSRRPLSLASCRCPTLASSNRHPPHRPCRHPSPPPLNVQHLLPPSTLLPLPPPSRRRLLLTSCRCPTPASSSHRLSHWPRRRPSFAATVHCPASPSAHHLLTGPLRGRNFVSLLTKFCFGNRNFVLLLNVLFAHKLVQK